MRERLIENHVRHMGGMMYKLLRLYEAELVARDIEIFAAGQ